MVPKNTFTIAPMRFLLVLIRRVAGFAVLTAFPSGIMTASKAKTTTKYIIVMSDKGYRYRIRVIGIRVYRMKDNLEPLFDLFHTICSVSRNTLKDSFKTKDTIRICYTAIILTIHHQFRKRPD